MIYFNRLPGQFEMWAVNNPIGSKGLYRCTGVSVLPKSWAREFLEWAGVIEARYDVSYEFELVEIVDDGQRT
jgi:hypothetical protein